MSQPGLLIVVNGACGVGKTTLGQELVETLDSSVFLDGDALDYVNPFALATDRQWHHLLGAVRVLLQHHAAAGYRHCVLTHVFQRGQVEALRASLSWPTQRTVSFRLTARAEVLAQRIERRASPDLKWELVRAAELERIFSGSPDPKEFVLDTSDHAPGDTLLAAKKVLFQLWRRSLWMPEESEQ